MVGRRGDWSRGGYVVRAEVECGNDGLVRRLYRVIAGCVVARSGVWLELWWC